MHPNYLNMLKCGFSQEDLVSAGYFEDNFNGKITLGFAGKFAPFHNGHLESILLAQKYFEEKGYYVEVVIFSAHDSYAGKTGYTYAMRRHSISTKIKTYPWIRISEEPAKYKNEVNFPWLVDILKKEYGEVGFIFGEDNAQFALAFIGTDTHCVCIERQGGLDALIRKIGRFKSTVNFHFITGNKHKDESATRIRALSA